MEPKEEWIKTTRMLIPGYMRYVEYKPGDSVDELDIWLGDIDHKYRICRCTNCGERFEVDAHDIGMRHELWAANHNAWLECPCCMSHVQMKNDRLLRNFRTMNGKYRVMFAEKLARDHVVLHAYYVEYRFTFEDDTYPELGFFEDMRYDLRPGAVKVERKVPYTRDEWDEVGIREPWPLVDAYTHIIKYYSFSADEIFDNTFLQYLPFDELNRKDWDTEINGYYTSAARSEQTPWARILCYAALIPQVEYAAKIGAWDFLRDLIMCNRKNVRLVNWKAKKPHEFLRMSKPEADEVIAQGCDKRLIALMHYHHLSASQARKWLDRGFTVECIKDAETDLGDSAEEIVKYLIKQGQGQNGVRVLHDYRRAAVQLGRDMDVPGIRWPKDLTRAHDEATASVEALMQENAQKGYSEFYKTLRQKYEYVTPEYMAIVPPRLSDIKLEGKLQHHCVGGYADRHAKGQCTIIFIRRTMLPLIPLYTVELSPDGTIKQIQGFNNKYENRPTGKAAEFVENWKREIDRRLLKNKKKPKKTKERAIA